MLALITTAASLSIIFGLLIGMLLAAGRCSDDIIAGCFSTFVVEAVRGVPLVALLFMFALAVPLLFPSHMSIDKFSRAVFALSLFASVQYAEVFRGGIIALKSSQIEAAAALGLSRKQIWILVIWPQVFRMTLPALVSSTVMAVKDNSVLVVIGLSDLLYIARAAASDPVWLGHEIELFLAVALLYLTLTTMVRIGGATLDRLWTTDLR